MKNIQTLCDFYVKNKRCEVKPLLYDQYMCFLRAVEFTDANKEAMISEVINATPGMKLYFQIHSIFPIKDEDYDWLNLLMLNILRASDEDVKAAHRGNRVPPSLLKKLAIFDPEPIGLEVDPIRIEYDFWGRGGPIRIVDLDWEQVKGISSDVEGFVSQYSPIEISPARSAYIIEDDLPF
jgi:hypothetical protein